MTDAQWADVSYYQRAVDDSYPNEYRVLAFRANDGTFRDPNFALNLAWCRAAIDSGRLDFFIVYTVYRTNWSETVGTLQSMVGTPHPRMVVMTDVETWGGQITGDQSAPINNMVEAIGAWLGDQRRSIGYGNRGDLAVLWPSKAPGEEVVVAGYGGATPVYPGMVGWQFSDRTNCPPFGLCDMNTSPGRDVAGLAALLGINLTNTTPPTPDAPLTPPEDDDMQLIKRVEDGAHILIAGNHAENLSNRADAAVAINVCTDHFLLPIRELNGAQAAAAMSMVGAAQV